MSLPSEVRSLIESLVIPFFRNPGDPRKNSEVNPFNVEAVQLPEPVPEPRRVLPVRRHWLTGCLS